MPEICRFYGIVIKMYFADHAPPHFHAEYAEHEARIAIESLAVISGKLPPRAMGLVAEWATLPTGGRVCGQHSAASVGGNNASGVHEHLVPITGTLLFGLTASDPTTATAVVLVVILVGAGVGLLRAY